MKQSYIIHITSRKNNDRNHLAKTVQLLNSNTVTKLHITMQHRNRKTDTVGI